MSRSVMAAPARSRALPLSSLALVIGVVPLVALAAVALFELANWDKITPGVTALGTSVGGLTRAEAVSRLTPGVQQLLDRPLDIQASDKTWHTTARDLGLRLDPNELVDAAYQVGRQGGPFDRLGAQLDTLRKPRSVTPACTTDRSALDNSLAAMAQQVERTPVDAHLTLTDTGNVEASQSQDGLTVDVAASRDQVTAALNGSGQTIQLVTQAVPPAVPDDQLIDAYQQLDHLFGATAEPFTATFADSTYRLEKADLLKIVTLTGGAKPGEKASVNIDDAALHAFAAKIAKDVNQDVQDARFAFNGGNLKVIRPSRQGRVLDQEGTVGAVRDALLNGQHTIALPVNTVDPSVSADNPQALGITELIDRVSTSFAGSIPEKKANIQLAAQRLNGVVVAPGQTFSFNKEVGPTTLDAGFEWGFGIASGDNGPKTVPSVAGGICQVATTLFQPVFWAGYQLEERYWHLYWIPAYTSRGVVGLDVTVDSDAGLDFQWTNTTKDYVLIQASADDSNIYFGLYGKKPNWTVKVDDAIISNRVSPDTKPIAQEEPSLPWGRTLIVETARDGFDAEVVRHVVPADGGKSRDLDLRSTYQPAHTVTLVGSAGKPASASIDDAVQRVLDAQKPTPTPNPAASAAPTVAPSPAAETQNKPAPTPAGQTQPAAPVQPTAVPKPAATAVPAAPTAAPKPQAQPTPAAPAKPTSAPAKPTAAPGH
jgi:vancomycin resistance protein YoaR